MGVARSAGVTRVLVVVTVVAVVTVLDLIIAQLVAVADLIGVVRWATNKSVERAEIWFHDALNVFQAVYVHSFDRYVSTIGIHSHGINEV